MPRSTNTQRAERLNAAFDLLADGYLLADAAAALTQQLGLSRRQAYRYLQQAQRIKRPVSVPEPIIPITIKVPQAVVARLRAYAQASGLTIGEIVARALLRYLTQANRRG